MPTEALTLKSRAADNYLQLTVLERPLKMSEDLPRLLRRILFFPSRGARLAR